MIMFGLLSVAVFTYGVYLSCVNGIDGTFEHYVIPELAVIYPPNSLRMERADHIAIDIEEDDEESTEENDGAKNEENNEENESSGECVPPSEEEEDEIITVEDLEEEEEEEESLSNEDTTTEEEDDESGSIDEDAKTGMGIDDLWSSYQLEIKYDEMKEKKPLKDYLNLKEWKLAVRRRFREFIESRWFRSNPEKFIRRERSKRNKDEYAVIDDTALNLVEYYHLKSSKEQ